MDLATKSRAVPFLPFRSSGEGVILCPGASVTQSKQRSLFAQNLNKAVRGELLLLAGSLLWFFCLYLLRTFECSSPLVALLSRDPP
jgi:hypothetical protein